MAGYDASTERLTAVTECRNLAAAGAAVEELPVRDLESSPGTEFDAGRRVAAFAVGVILVVGAVAALHNLYRAGDSAADLLGWVGLLLLGMTALGGGIKLASWGAKPITAPVFDMVKKHLSEPAQAVVAALGVIAGAVGMWWTFRGGYTSWWSNLTGESGWSLLLGVGQMLVAVLAGAALFVGGGFLAGLAKEALDTAAVGEHRHTPVKRGADTTASHPALVAALIAGGIGLVVMTAWLVPRLAPTITGVSVLPAVAAIALVLVVAVGSNLGWWKGLGGLWQWVNAANQKAAAIAGVTAVLLFSAGGLGLGWFTPATVPLARAACPPDCGGGGGLDGPPGGGQIFQPPSQGGQQMPDYSSGNYGRPPLDQNSGISIYNESPAAQQVPSQTGGQQSMQEPPFRANPDGSWQARNGEWSPPNYQTASPGLTQGPGRPNPDWPGNQGGQANPGSQGGDQAGQRPAQQAPQQAQQPPQENPGQQPNQQPQQSDSQKIDDLTQQLQQQQQQSGQDRQRIDDLTKQLQNQKQQNSNQKLPRMPEQGKDRDKDQRDRDQQSGNNDLAALLMGAASTRRRKQDEQEQPEQQQGPDTQALAQDGAQLGQSLPGDVTNYVSDGTNLASSAGQAAQGYGQAAQAGASLASSAQSGAVNPMDAVQLVQGVSQGVQGTADAVNSGSQVVKTAQGQANQIAQAVGDANPQLKPQMQQLTKLNDQASQVTDLVGQGAQITSQGAGAVNSVSSLGAGGIPDSGGTAEAMSGPTDAAAEVQSVELMSGPVPQDVPGGDTPTPPGTPEPTFSITGMTTPQQTSRDKVDLLTKVPGKNLSFTGDPKEGTSQLNGAPNPINKPGERALPMGYALGQNDRPYGMFSIRKYSETDGELAKNPWNFISPHTSVYDLSNPGSPALIGQTPGSQSSGAYDPISKTMVIVGNDGWGSSAPRSIWQSTPVDPSKPNDWINHLTKIGDITGGGDRENQILALPGGGLLLLDANMNQINGGIYGATAWTPQQLLNPDWTYLVAGDSAPNPNALGTVNSVYGPTASAITPGPAGSNILNVATGMSAWPFNEADPGGYHPETWTSTLSILVQQPPTP